MATTTSTRTRTERDSLGDVPVPVDALYGAQTARAVENFPISGIRPHRVFIESTAMVKWAAAMANMAIGKLPPEKGDAIARAAKEIIGGAHHAQFVVDVFQAGAGTSHNMNANEVIANRANELLGGRRGEYAPVHPNDDVNMSQSTNDIFPTITKVAALRMLPGVIAQLQSLEAAFRAKAEEFADVVKSGRTHLQDAVPTTLGAEFGGYAHAIKHVRERIEGTAHWVGDLNIGATALGTGLNSGAGYRGEAVKFLKEITGIADLRPAENLFEVTQSMAPLGALSGDLRTIALELIRIANDLRLMASGPRTGLFEIALPAVQPGSSIMPGKVNPVMAEMLDMVCFQVVGNDTTVALAVQAGQLDLNVMMPVIAFNIVWSMEILTNAVRVFIEFCARGITANRERINEWVEQSTAIVTALNQRIGYSRAAKVAQQAFREGRTVRDVLISEGILTADEAARFLDPAVLVQPGDSTTYE
ncbi:MAG TPA: aspartate ammonia-lyase [Thermomicrobiales bacterium]|jgi:aspartate ammonia-lyase